MIEIAKKLASILVSLVSWLKLCVLKECITMGVHGRDNNENTTNNINGLVFPEVVLKYVS